MDDYEEMRADLLVCATRRVGINDAEDVVQEALVRAWQQGRKEPAYVFGILRHVVVDMLRERERDAVGIERLAERVEGAAEPDIAPDLSMLPSHLSSALEARMGGCTYAEAGEMAGVTAAAARYRVWAGVEQLRKQVIKLGYRSAEECFADNARASVYRAPTRTGSALAVERQARLK